MNPESLHPQLERLHARADVLREALSAPDIYADAQRCRTLNAEYNRLRTLFETFARWETIRTRLLENWALLAAESDFEMQALIKADNMELDAQNTALEREVRLQLVPPDPASGRRIMVELHPAAGGEEAALFCGEMFLAYSRYAERHHWKFELLSCSESDFGGMKDVVFSLAGPTAYDRMKFESGVHRVQRVPVTEAGGRIHTSTITVSVLPEAEEIDFELKMEDLKFDVFRSSGPGGQCVNTTDSAVRVTHIPSGVSVASQQEKSQHRNKEIAIRILRSRLLEVKVQEEQAKRSDSKRTQVGTGDRSERIRTYNFPQSRCTDHRYGISVYNLPQMLEGDFDPLLDQILNADAEEKLTQLGLCEK